jgi:F-type H+-transporting ATPase subunit delta
MQDSSIGRRYARALALALGEKADLKQLQKIEGELSALAALLDKNADFDEFRQAMLNPSFSPEDRLAILRGIADANKFEDVTKRLLDLLVEKERVPYLPSIARAFRAEVDERSGQVRAHITTARVLKDGDLSKLVAALEKKTGKTVVPEVEVEPEILGGVQATIGGYVFDNSVRSQLERMRQTLSA